MSATDRRMAQLKKDNPNSFQSVRLRNTDTVANDRNDTKK